MGDNNCPRCGSPMEERQHRELQLLRCTSCSGIFLDRTDLGVLSELESDWHRGSGPHTEPIPRITADMVAPPPAGKTRANSFIETLFG